MIRYKKILFYICTGLLIFVVVWFFRAYRAKIGRILTPFFLTIPLVYIIKPLAAKLASRKIPASLSIILVYFIFLLLLAAACIFFIPELAMNIRELMETLPELMSSYEQIFNRLLSAIKSSSWSDNIKTVIFKEIENGTAMVQKSLVGVLENGLDILVDTVKIIVDLTISMVIAYYVIKDADKFIDYILSILPLRWRKGLAGIGREINRILAGFIQGQLLTALIVGVLETMGLLIIKMKYSLALGMLGGLANIIPYFGPYIGVIPALAIALTLSPMKALWTIVVFVVVQQIDNNFISPKMIEGKLGLHPVATIFAVLVGGEFFGILGMLLAVPVMAIIRVLLNKVVDAIA
jgi:predicted PurR-regulated permease PerM